MKLTIKERVYVFLKCLFGVAIVSTLVVGIVGAGFTYQSLVDNGLDGLDAHNQLSWYVFAHAVLFPCALLVAWVLGCMCGMMIIGEGDYHDMADGSVALFTVFGAVGVFCLFGFTVAMVAKGWLSIALDNNTKTAAALFLTAHSITTAIVVVYSLLTPCLPRLKG